MNDEGQWTVVATYEALHEAELAAGRLDTQAIPARIDQRDGVGLWGPGYAGKSVRGVALLVPSDLLTKARQALDLE